MPTKSSTTKTATGSNKKTTSAKTSSTSAKKGSAVNVKTPTARDRARDFDEGRRNDANSNEL